MVTELVHYRTLPGIAAADHLRAAQAVQDDVLRALPGFLGRRLGQDPTSGEWVDVVHWTDHAAHDAAMAHVMANPAVGGWMAQMDPDSIRMPIVPVQLDTSA